jgi:hypothetical protein
VNVARPPEGFHIHVDPRVEQYIEAEIGNNFRVKQLWADLLARISITALKEGTPLPFDDLRFTYIADGAPDFQIPTIQVCYRILGENLTVYAALVWNEHDQDLWDAALSNPA